MLAVDITSTFSLLQKEKGAGLKNFDFLLGDLAQFSGVTGEAGAFFISHDPKTNAKVKGIIDFIGNNLQPMNCYQIMRGLKTLSLRIEESILNASQIIDKLSHSKDHISLLPDTNIIIVNQLSEKVNLDGLEAIGHNLTLSISKAGKNQYIVHVTIEDFERQLEKI